MMLHDVTIDTFHPFRGSHRHVVVVDAVSGDEAAALGAVEANALSEGAPWKIVGITPSSVDTSPPAFAAVEGGEFEDDAPVKRAPGRPRKDG